jgi:hypothetical protein
LHDLIRKFSSEMILIKDIYSDKNDLLLSLNNVITSHNINYSISHFYSRGTYYLVIIFLFIICICNY